MIQVPEEIKELLKQGSIRKNFRVHFPNGEHSDITNKNILSESVSFTESICSQDTLKFGLCESSTLSFETFGVGNIKGKIIDCQIEIDCSSLSDEFIEEYCITPQDLNYPIYAIPYGRFIIDSCDRDSGNMQRRTIEGYSIDTLGIHEIVNLNCIKYLQTCSWPKAKNVSIPIDFLKDCILGIPNMKDVIKINMKDAISGVNSTELPSIKLFDKYYDYSTYSSGHIEDYNMRISVYVNGELFKAPALRKYEESTDNYSINYGIQYLKFNNCDNESLTNMMLDSINNGFSNTFFESVSEYITSSTDMQEDAINYFLNVLNTFAEYGSVMLGIANTDEFNSSLTNVKSKYVHNADYLSYSRNSGTTIGNTVRSYIKGDTIKFMQTSDYSPEYDSSYVIHEINSKSESVFLPILRRYDTASNVEDSYDSYKVSEIKIPQYLQVTIRLTVNSDNSTRTLFNDYVTGNFINEDTEFKMAASTYYKTNSNENIMRQKIVDYDFSTHSYANVREECLPIAITIEANSPSIEASETYKIDGNVWVKNLTRASYISTKNLLNDENISKKLLEAICELYCVFGTIDRKTGQVKFIDILDSLGLYPSDANFPEDTLYPRGHSNNSQLLQRSMYSSAWYDDSPTKKYSSVVCRYKDTNGNEATETYEIIDLTLTDESGNLVFNPQNYQVYDISDNFIISNITATSSQINKIVSLIGESIKHIQYMPADIDCMGLPYIEAGDAVDVFTSNGAFETLVLRRTLTGIQALLDNIESKG